MQKLACCADSLWWVVPLGPGSRLLLPRLPLVLGHDQAAQLPQLHGLSASCQHRQQLDWR